MRTKVKPPAADIALLRILDDLAQELIDAPDDEVVLAAKDLGMDPNMPGSAAFAGLKYPARPQLSDFFDDLDAYRQLLTTQRPAIASSPKAGSPKLSTSNSQLPASKPMRKTRRSQRTAIRAPRKGPGDR